MIYHIASRTAWLDAQANGAYTAASLATERFIHCSTLEQVLPVANTYYKGESGLCLLVIEPTLLSSTLKWEPPSGGAPPPGVAEGVLFPHVFGSINLNAVVKVIDLKSEEGTFILPTNL